MPRGTYLHLEDGTEERFQCAPGPGGWRYVASRTDGTRVDLVVDARWRQIRVEFVAPDWWLRGGVTGREVAWVRAASSGEATEHSTPASGFLGESPAFAIAIARYLAEVRPQRPHPSDLNTTIPGTTAPSATPPDDASPNANTEDTLSNDTTSEAQSPGTTSSESWNITSEEPAPVDGPRGTEPGPSEWAGTESSSGAEVDASEHNALLAGTAVDVRLVRVSGFALATLTESSRWRLASVTRHETETGPLPVEQYEVADLSTGELQHVHLAGDVILDAPGIELIDLDGPPNFLTS
ncbi:hypothetical protein [Actinomadura oligospora]|uniref:hypothetical protein n=1 Tax=Actinomadura oligospora TaxID=111804 RepID=UPI0004B9E77B|nr:hypothetical protein [Actinomadura oligospora]